MSKKVGIWLDHEKAYVITLKEGTQDIERIESNVESRVRFEGETKQFSRIGGALYNPSKKRTNRRRQQINSYIRDLAERVNKADGIYLFGPAEAKQELNKLLFSRRNKPSVYIEPAGRMTEKQMIARVREHFSSDR